MAIISKLIEGLTNDVEHFVRVYPINPKGFAQSELDGQIASALTNAFPAEPSSYNLIGTYSSSQTFTAPEDGWYQIELFGRSGAGGGASGKYLNPARVGAAGGGGGGGAYAKSRIKCNKGDTIVIVIETTCAVAINSTLESYNTLRCYTGNNGGNGVVNNYSSYSVGAGGAGGTAEGGNISNINGNAGSDGGLHHTSSTSGSGTATGGAGGAPGYTGGNQGGDGSSITVKSTGTSTNNGETPTAAGSAKPGFVKIYRGDTNVVAA